MSKNKTDPNLKLIHLEYNFKIKEDADNIINKIFDNVCN